MSSFLYYENINNVDIVKHAPIFNLEDSEDRLNSGVKSVKMPLDEILKIIEIPNIKLSKSLIYSLIVGQLFGNLKYKLFTNEVSAIGGYNWDSLEEFINCFPDYSGVPEYYKSDKLTVIYMHYSFPELENVSNTKIYLEILDSIATSIDEYQKHKTLVYFPSSAKEQIEKILSEEN
jgi:hypothetical protein